MSNLTVTVSPHLFTEESTEKVMRSVIIALLPATITGVYLFGWSAALNIMVSIIFALLAEITCQKIMKRPVTVQDASAFLTGLLLALTLPPTFPLWMTALGSFLSIVLGKQIFGGLGFNIFNPALVGRAILMACWPKEMTDWTAPFSAVTSATPLNIERMGLAETLPSYWPMFSGTRAGSIGETSTLALLAGSLFLLFKKRIPWVIPVFYILTTGLLSLVWGRDPLFEIMAGGLILGAFFMATDPVTSPITTKGRIIFAVGCGLMTVLIRIKGGFPEGVCYSILILNMFVPLIDKYTKPKRFGT